MSVWIAHYCDSLDSDSVIAVATTEQAAKRKAEEGFSAGKFFSWEPRDEDTSSLLTYCEDTGQYHEAWVIVRKYELIDDGAPAAEEMLFDVEEVKWAAYRACVYYRPTTIKYGDRTVYLLDESVYNDMID